MTAGSAVLVVAAAAGRAVAADNPPKMAQKDVAYQPTPHEGQACATCVQFEPPTGCKVVEGRISAAGWCQLYAKKT